MTEGAMPDNDVFEITHPINMDWRQFLELQEENKRLKSRVEELENTAKILFEHVHHKYNCPELKSGDVCNCGFHEVIARSAKVLTQAESAPRREGSK